MPTIRFSIDLRKDAKNWVRVGQMKNMQYGSQLSDFTAEILPPAGGVFFYNGSKHSLAEA